MGIRGVKQIFGCNRLNKYPSSAPSEYSAEPVAWLMVRSFFYGQRQARLLESVRRDIMETPHMTKG
jgi:hypothetical protein